MKFLLILLFAVPAFAQSEKIYVVTDTVRQVVNKELKTLAASDPKDAGIFVEYAIVFRETSDAVVGGLVVGSYEQGTMTAYRERDGKRVVVWTGTDVGSPWAVPKKLAKRLKSALKKDS